MKLSKPVQKYVNSIRNPAKQHYAGLYAMFLLGITYKPSDAGISVMAGQSVRRRLEELTHVDGPTELEAEQMIRRANE